MPDFRRYFVPGGTYFFTVVTAGRRPLFRSLDAARMLGELFREVDRELPFKTIAIVVLPDHLHSIWALPSGDHDYPRRWRAIKARFTRNWLTGGGTESRVPVGYKQQRRRGIWQPRYFEHLIRDETDLSSHADYIHYNPVKHGLARCPRDWSLSTFTRFAGKGHYPSNWGCSDGPRPEFPRVDERLVE